MEQAAAAQANAYVPYSQYAVGAALLTGDGEIFTGVSVENASYGLAVCAERVAIWRAVSEGARVFTALAVVGPDNAATSLCGACKQVLGEFTPRVTFVSPTASQDITLFKCFISYSHKDERLARKIFKRLQREGLEVVFAPVSMRPGDKIKEYIKHSIGRCDKLIVILSRHSMESPWVAEELRYAREKENRTGRPIIIPVSLASQGEIADWKSACTGLDEDLAEVVRGIKMADFSGWRDKEQFDKSLAGLLPALTSWQEHGWDRREDLGRL